MRHCAKFRVDRSNCCSDIAIFRFFFSKWWPSAILDLLCASFSHPWRIFGSICHCI